MRQNSYWILLVCALLMMGGVVDATSILSPPPNIRITTISQLNNEEQVFICPTDSNIIIANWRDFRLGYRQIGIGRSTDGGQTWGQVNDGLLGATVVYSIAVDKDSNVYAATPYGVFKLEDK